MRSKINFITLAVSNLQESIKFYREVFQFEINEQDENLCLFKLEDNFYLTLQTRKDFILQSGDNNSSFQSAGFILSHNAESIEEVDES